ncbi:hypothetical protein [Streptomyces sp. NPDC005485]|uniref:hypothetical protein n=1 Tax=Streptomyces sp. NPDC005485 TaxID=3155591 RepID=UPI0033B57CEF
MTALVEVVQNGPVWLVGAIAMLSALAFLINAASSGLAKILREKTPQESTDRVRVIELQIMEKQAKRRDRYRRWF